MSALVGALLALFGVAPVVTTALSDVNSVFGGHLFLFVAIAALGALLSVLAIERARPHSSTGQTRDAARFGLIFATTMIATGLATSFLVWEGDNLTSWRMAERLQAGPGVIKHRASKHGTQLVQLKIVNREGSGLILGSLRLPWHLAVSGGLVTIATRSDGTANSDDCEASELDGIVTLDAQCNQWSLSRVAVRPGTETLVLQVLKPSQQVTSIDIGFESAAARFSWLWVSLSWLAFAYLVSCAIYVVRDAPADSVRTEKSAGSVLRWERRFTYWTVASATLFVIVANVGVGSFVAKERTIYAWDFGGHWMSAVTVSRAIGKNDTSNRVGSAIDASTESARKNEQTAPEVFWAKPGSSASVLRSIRYWEYNISAAIPLAIPMSLDDGSRMSYALSLVNVYALPAVLILMLVLWAVTHKQQERMLSYWPLIPSAAILLFNPFWVPLLRGYIGVCVVAVNLLVFWLYFRRHVNEQRMAELLLIAVLLAVSVVMRRWNAYWVVAFFVIASIDAIIALVSSRQASLRTFVRSFSGVFVIGLGALAALSVLAWPLIVTMLTTDYADIYSAYADSDGSFAGHVGHFIRTFGAGLIAFTLVAVLYLLRYSRHRKLTMLLTLHLTIVVVHVSSTQEMGPHHMYLLMPSALILLALACLDALSRTDVPIRAGAVVLAVAYLANGIASNIAVFAPGGDVVRAALVPVVPNNRRTPLVREDIDEFGRLASFLDSRVEQMGPDARIYVLASSPVFNVATLKMLEVSTGIPFESKDRLLRTTDVDKRDGFPEGIFEAAIVAVATPVQVHHKPEEQQVIVIPAEMILSATGIGNAFEMMPQTFELDDDVMVQLYRRTRGNSPEERAELSNRLRAAYPDRPAIYGR